mgnify:FL=1
MTEPQEGLIKIHDFLDLMPGFVCLLKPDYSIWSGNAGFREIFGDSKSLPCFQFFFTMIRLVKIALYGRP